MSHTRTIEELATLADEGEPPNAGDAGRATASPPTGDPYIRTAHGTGAPAIWRAERPPLDETPPPAAADTLEGLERAAATGRPFQVGNSAGRNRKCALALLGVPIDTADPRYRRAVRKAAAYRTRRARELGIEHAGHLGSGPSAMLASSALALAASRVLYELAGETLDPALFVQAARLADSSRQQELTAVALAAREAAARGEDEGADLRRKQAQFQKALAERGRP